MDNVVPCDPYIVFEACAVVSYISWPPKDKFASLHGIEDGFHRDTAHKEGYRYCSIHWRECYHQGNSFQLAN